MSITAQKASAGAAASGRLVLVDGHAYAYRAFHAIRSLSSPSGEPTNAIFGFVKMLERLRAVLQPSHWAVAWDGGLAIERTQTLPEYKAQRPPMPDSLARQIDGMMAWLKACGMASFWRDGVEADDWIASLARQMSAPIPEVIIASSDKDFMQLVSDRIGLVNPAEAIEKIWTAADVKAKTGVAPEQIVDWLSLVGDAVDNIAGVEGIGPKRAAELLRQFGSLEAVLSDFDRVENPKVREKFRQAADILRRNQRLIRLREDVAGGVDAADLLFKPADTPALAALYEKWGFRTLLNDLRDKPLAQVDLFGVAA